jgi:hypothetical protein
MKSLISFLLGGVLLFALTGCEDMRYAKYDGQPKAWPTGSSFSEKVFAVPVFTGWPEKPYNVLGFVQFANPNIDWNQGDIKQAASKAKEVGGDAMLMIPKGAVSSPSLEAMCKDLGLTGSHTTAVVLKWK